MITKIKKDDFSAVEKADVSVVDFSAVWCGPCRMLEPVMEELSGEYDGKIQFFNADVDENSALSSKFAIMNIPAVVLLKNGKEIDRKIGFMPKELIKEWLDSKL